MNPSGLAGRRVVVTQQRPAALADRLRAYGATVDHVPLTEIGEPVGRAALDAALDRLERFDWLVVSSVNGARRVGAAAATAPFVRLAAVGSATAAALAERAGRPVDLVPSVHRVEGLLAELPRGTGEVLVAKGNLAGAELADGLRSLGYTVTSVDAYATVLRRPDAIELELLRTADVVVLASGSAAQRAERGDPDPRLGGGDRAEHRRRCRGGGADGGGRSCLARR